MSVTIKLRRDTSANWARYDPVLAEGEPGYENDTGKFKIGDGLARWSSLEYFSSGSTGLDESKAYALSLVEAHINSLTPHPIYDDGPSLVLLYQNAKV